MPRRFAVLGLLALVLTGCGPSDEEIARSVLFSTPAPFVVGTTILYAFFRSWRRLRPDTVMELRPSLQALVVLIGFSGLALTGRHLGQTTQGDWSPDRVVSLSGLTVWIYGTSYIAIHFSTWRVWFAIRPTSAFTWSFVVPTLVCLVPGLPFAAGLTRDLFVAAVVIWAYPGVGGIVPLVLILGFVIELVVRHKRARREKTADAGGVVADEPT